MIDYMVMEAIALKVAEEDEQVEKEAERNNWKKDSGGLDALRDLAG